MRNEDKWARQVKEELDDYLEPVPAGLWEELEKELQTPPKVIPMWKRWQTVAAAAVVVMTLVSVWSVWLTDEVQEMKLPVTADVLPLSEEEKKISDLETPQDEVPASSAVEQIIADNRSGISVRQISEDELTDSSSEDLDNLTDAHETAFLQTDDADESKAAVEHSQKVQENITDIENAPRRTYSARNYKSVNVDKEKLSGAKLEIGLNYGNSPLASSNTYQGFTSFSRSASMHVANGDLTTPVNDANYVYSQILYSAREEEVKSDVDHAMPVTIGASVHYRINEKWGIETGLNYTMLSSNLHSGTSSSYIDSEQKLHYLGIPLKLHRSIWSNRYWDVYASAGGMIEKCISAKNISTSVSRQAVRKEEERMDIDNLQFSLALAAGLQFKFSNWSGIYVEPGMAYYFDDGEETLTIRKEHPFNFNLQLGFRFILPN